MKRLILILLLLPCVLRGQQIVTFAGCGIVGAPLGDGGPALAANVTLPSFGCFDAAGNYYFFQNVTAARIRKVSTTGIITTVAGTGSSGYSGDNGPATSAMIDPAGVCVDSAGNIFIADHYNYRVRKVDFATGNIHTIAGDGTATSTGDGVLAINATTIPTDVLTDNRGNIFIADDGIGIRKIDTSGIITTIVSGIGGNISFDFSGHLLLSGTRIVRIDTSTGLIDTIAGTGTAWYNGDSIPAITANFRARDIAVDDIGNIFFSDDVNNRIRKIDLNGIIYTVAGTGVAGYAGDGGPADSAQFHFPLGVTFDTCGNLYIGDEQNKRIRKIEFNPNCILIDTTTSTLNQYLRHPICIYPNPTQNELIITAGSNIKELAIINAMGQRVLSQSCNGTKQTVQTGGLSAGVYFVVLRDEGNAVVFRGRFVKE